MKNKNQFLAKQQAAIDEAFRISERITRQFDVDSYQIALARYAKLDLGYQRIMEITELAEQVREEYRKAFMNDPEADVYRHHMDQELAEICKGREIILYDERYPEMKKITYEGRRKK